MQCVNLPSRFKLPSSLLPTVSVLLPDVAHIQVKSPVGFPSSVPCQLLLGQLPIVCNLKDPELHFLMIALTMLLIIPPPDRIAYGESGDSHV